MATNRPPDPPPPDGLLEALRKFSVVPQTTPKKKPVNPVNPPRKLAKLISRFTHNKVNYRLIAKAKATAGHEDTYVIEREGTDELGDVRWESYHSFPNDEDRNAIQLRLISALKQAQQEQREPIVSAITTWISKQADDVNGEVAAQLIAIADAIHEGRPFE